MSIRSQLEQLINNPASRMHYSTQENDQFLRNCYKLFEKAYAENNEEIKALANRLIEKKPLIQNQSRMDFSFLTSGISPKLPAVIGKIQTQDGNTFDITEDLLANSTVLSFMKQETTAEEEEEFLVPLPFSAQQMRQYLQYANRRLEGFSENLKEKGALEKVITAILIADYLEDEDLLKQLITIFESYIPDFDCTCCPSDRGSHISSIEETIQSLCKIKAMPQQPEPLLKIEELFMRYFWQNIRFTSRKEIYKQYENLATRLGSNANYILTLYLNSKYQNTPTEADLYFTSSDNLDKYK